MKDCNQCGKCCIKYGDGGIEATIEEIEMWEIFRPHIHQYVRNNKIWFNPNTGQQLSQCPFLEKTQQNKNSCEQIKYTCAIYEDRPEDCRLYPSSIGEMVLDECEMIEPIDLTHPKHAQIQLDKLMSDSRPANNN
ncbi:MAG: YkgJ family cysteine cluster protein [Colwelliaceae bacterium]|nr:YkgJ family cysteine cluster protein [Colwelliaceae bacterium]